MRRACAAEPVYARFGSIFHDLPYYYAPMVFEAVLRTGAPALDEPWVIVCTRSIPSDWSNRTFAPPAPCLDLAIRTARARRWIAFTLRNRLGNASVCQLLRPSRHTASWRLRKHPPSPDRKYQALFIHLWRLGDDQIGLPAFAERCRITKHGNSLSLKIEQPILDLMQQAFRGAYGSAPSVLPV